MLERKKKKILKTLSDALINTVVDLFNALNEFFWWKAIYEIAYKGFHKNTENCWSPF